MVEAEPPLVLGDDGVGGARDLVGVDAEALGDALRKEGLARPEAAAEGEDEAAAGAAADALSQGEGLLGRAEPDLVQGSFPARSSSRTRCLMEVTTGTRGQAGSASR